MHAKSGGFQAHFKDFSIFHLFYGSTYTDNKYFRKIVHTTRGLRLIVKMVLNYAALKICFIHMHFSRPFHIQVFQDSIFATSLQFKDTIWVLRHLF